MKNKNQEAKGSGMPDLDQSIRSFSTSLFKRIIVRQLQRDEETIAALNSYIGTLEDAQTAKHLWELKDLVGSYVCFSADAIGVDPLSLSLLLPEYEGLTYEEIRADMVKRYGTLPECDISIDDDLVECREVDASVKRKVYREIADAKADIDKIEPGPMKEKLEYCLVLAYKAFCRLFAEDDGFAEERSFS